MTSLGRSALTGGDDVRLVSLNFRPARRGQHQYRQPSSGEVLLVAQVLVGCDEGVEVSFRRLQEGAVVEFGPAHFMGRRDGVAKQCATQRRRSSMVV